MRRLGEFVVSLGFGHQGDKRSRMVRGLEKGNKYAEGVQTRHGVPSSTLKNVLGTQIQKPGRVALEEERTRAAKRGFWVERGPRRKWPGGEPDGDGGRDPKTHTGVGTRGGGVQKW
ncbi:unnamed protein product [Arctia plantaginis]|uniref:Uncharacterized protein n=1 Tax=Arctia plantaginis TaxID=874455 RepID=A0A8S0ZFH3_ARCPL|nr:unnamed protein product [Arctia plantaginis]